MRKILRPGETDFSDAREWQPTPRNGTAVGAFDQVVAGAATDSVPAQTAPDAVITAAEPDRILGDGIPEDAAACASFNGHGALLLPGERGGRAGAMGRR